MSNLKEKLEQSIAQYQQQVQELDNLKASLLVQQGAIQALQSLLQEDAAVGDDKSSLEETTEPSKKEKAIQTIKEMIVEPSARPREE